MVTEGRLSAPHIFVSHMEFHDSLGRACFVQYSWRLLLFFRKLEFGLESLDGCEHRWCACVLGEIIARRIIELFTDDMGLNNAIHKVDGVALAAIEKAYAPRALVGKHHVQRYGEVRGRIAHEGNHGAFNALVL